MYLITKLIQISVITFSLIVFGITSTQAQAESTSQGAYPSWGHNQFHGMGGYGNPMMGMMNPMMMNPMMGMMNPMMMNPMMGGYGNPMGQMPGGQMMDPKQYEEWFNQFVEMMNPKQYEKMFNQWVEMMDPKQYEEWFNQWTEAMNKSASQNQAN